MVITRQFLESAAGDDDPRLIAGPTLVQSLWQRRLLIVVVALLSIAVGYGLSSLRSPMYTATATVFLTDPSRAELFGRDSPDPERHVEQQASRMRSGSVFRAAAARLGADADARGIARRVEVTAEPEVGVIRVEAAARSPQAAADTANAVARSYEEVSRQAGAELLDSAARVFDRQMAGPQDEINRLRQQLQKNPDDLTAQSSLDAVETQLAELRTSLSEIATEIAFHGTGVDVIEDAAPPERPSSPKPKRDAALFGMFGLALATAYSYWRAGALAAARTDAGEVLGAPLLAQIPEFRSSEQGLAEVLFDTEAVETYQFLVASVEHALAQIGGASVVVSSAAPHEGKSLTALHLARALALQGRDVVLVDAAVRARGLTELLQAEDDDGLAELAGGRSLADVEQTYRVSPATRLRFVPVGRPTQSPVGLLSTTAYRRAIETVVQAAEIAVVDGESLLSFADASAVAAGVDGIVLVVDAHTSPELLEGLAERLRFIATPLLGYVINRATAGRVRRTWQRWLSSRRRHPRQSGEPDASGPGTRGLDDGAAAHQELDAETQRAGVGQPAGQ